MALDIRTRFEGESPQHYPLVRQGHLALIGVTASWAPVEQLAVVCFPMGDGIVISLEDALSPNDDQNRIDAALQSGKVLAHLACNQDIQIVPEGSEASQNVVSVKNIGPLGVSADISHLDWQV